MIEDQKIAAAVARISQRAERQEDLSKLVDTYVDVGILPQLDNTNHQIFYGRRGTGKTHVLKVLAARFEKKKANTVVYIDCRTLGSTMQFSDNTAPLPKRCIALFRDILVEIHTGLERYIAESPSQEALQALAGLEALLTLVTKPSEALIPKRATEEAAQSGGTSRETKAALSFKEGLPSIGIDQKYLDQSQNSQKHNVEYEISQNDKIVFPELAKALSDVLKLAKTKLYVLVDEWSSLPQEVQPYLAEFLKRAILPLSSATLKIAALEYRCRFTTTKADDTIGFEVGADISTAPDLDDYYVFDRTPEQAVKICGEILFRHLESELPNGYLKKKYRIDNDAKFVSRMFTQRKVFTELVRASEGVVRDLINIFTRAFFYAQQQGRSNLDRKCIHYAARQWFEQDKANALDNELTTVLGRIVTEVIGTRKTRSFMVSRELEKNPVVQRLFDARVLHLVTRGYADKDNTGIRYNIYNIDYGAYVDLIGTSNEPELGFSRQHDAETDIIVPFNDKRSIRRVILDESVLG